MFCVCALGRLGGARAAPPQPRLRWASASVASVSARATAARGAAGSRKIWKTEAAEPAEPAAGWESWEGGAGRIREEGKTGLARSPSLGGREDCCCVRGEAATGPALGLRLRLRGRPWVVVGTQGNAWRCGKVQPRPAPSRVLRPPPLARGQPQPQCPPAGLAAPRGPCAASRCALRVGGPAPAPAVRGSVRWRPLCSEAAGPGRAAPPVGGKAVFSFQSLGSEPTGQFLVLCPYRGFEVPKPKLSGGNQQHPDSFPFT